MAKLGSEENPLVLNVHNQIDFEMAVGLCHGRDWKYILSMNLEEPEDLSDLDKKMRPVVQSYRPEKHGRNELCPCGSGKKYKKCCLANICTCCGFAVDSDIHRQSIENFPAP